MKTYRVAMSCLVVFLTVALYGGAASSSIVYVNKVAAGNGNGLSWENACNTIQAGVDAALSGDEIWVAKGTYTATASPSITMKEGVPIYGGFVGTETTRDARDASANATIIDGAGNFQCLKGASNTTLDGFTVQNGRLTAGNGAGMYNASCTALTLSHCTFSNHTVFLTDASAFGGALYNSGSSLTITNCTFSGNAANGYLAEGHGGALYSTGCSLAIANCSFTENSAEAGYGDAFGGAIESVSSTLTLTQCTFSQNESRTTVAYDDQGGAIRNTSTTFSITGCTFSGNQAFGDPGFVYGGAIFNDSSTGTLLNCVFTGNAASCPYLNAEGGAISGNGTYDVVNCLFIGNTTDGCYFSGGGAVSTTSGSPRFINCTFTGNTCSSTEDGYGGAFYTYSNSYPVITNCILYADSASYTSELYLEGAASFNITCSSVSGGWSGTGNVDVNPLFVDGTDGGDGYDLRLQANSQCINKGTDTSSTVSASALDFLGIARPQGTAYDMGAYEYVAPVAAFSLSVSSGAVPLDVTFTDTSTTSASWPITAWAWTFGDGTTSTEENPTHTYLAVGTYSVSLTVTTANGTSTVTHSVTAERGTAPVTTWPTASAIGYGQALSASALSGGASSTPGTFAFANPATVPNTGIRDEAVVFTATDGASYNPAYGTASVTVTQATPAVSPWPSANGITYGQALSESALSGGSASVAGTFAFASPELKPAAGTYAAAVTFAPSDAVNYASLSGTADVEVAKAAPTITTLPVATGITYGQHLSASILTGGQAKAGTTAIAGSFAFTAPSTLPDTAGAYTAEITFTPADTDNYLLASGSVAVAVTAIECPECNATTGPYTAGQTACLTVPGTFSSSATFSWARQDNVALDTTRSSGIACQRLQITDLRIADSATYECTYTDGAASDVYTVTIAVTEAQSVPVALHGCWLAVVVAFMGIVAGYGYRRHLAS